MWSQRFTDALRDMGFVLSKAEKDIWMRDMGDHCECIAVCVDDLMIVSRNPADIIVQLEGPCTFKLKGVLFHPLVKGEVASFGFFPKILTQLSIIFSMHLRGAQHSAPSSSLKKSHPRWNDTGPVPLSLKVCGPSSWVMMSAGLRLTIIKSSTLKTGHCAMRPVSALRR